jgi:hypothetical protein
MPLLYHDFQRGAVLEDESNEAQLHARSGGGGQCLMNQGYCGTAKASASLSNAASGSVGGALLRCRRSLLALSGTAAICFPRYDRAREVGAELQTLSAALGHATNEFRTSSDQSSRLGRRLNWLTKWGPAPPMLPDGAQIALLAGDPTKAIPYAIRLKFPANYAIPAHSHPTDEHVVVTSGALTFGMGDRLIKGAAANKTLAVGGFALMPANMNHFAYTASKETTIVLYGQGPVEFKYVNPSDDPRAVNKGTKWRRSRRNPTRLSGRTTGTERSILLANHRVDKAPGLPDNLLSGSAKGTEASAI